MIRYAALLIPLTAIAFAVTILYVVTSAMVLPLP